MPAKDHGKRIGWMQHGPRGKWAVIGGKKSVQFRAAEEFARNSGCELNDLGIFPRTYTLEKENSDGCARLAKQQASRLGPHGLDWIVKKSDGGAGGIGITVHRASGENPLTTKVLYERYCGGNYIVQQYVSPPLLLKNKYKFDFRIYMVLARADPWMVYYRDGYARRAGAEYGDGKSRLADVTNDSRMKDGPRLAITPYEKYWSFIDLQRWLDKNRGPAHKNYVRDVMRPYLKEVVRFFFLTGALGHTVHGSPEYAPGLVNLWGLDLAMDESLNIFLLEGNGAPLHRQFYSSGMGTMRDNMHASAFKLALDVQTKPFKRTKPPVKSGGWELAYYEPEPACRQSTFYNPCTVFAGKTQAQVAQAARHKHRMATPWYMCQPCVLLHMLLATYT